ncbi:hypothetical protein H5410_057832 [Solanum commersonii]|uniref:RNase H type-1 domain-containing protein n=1 Tax=Solanum commersonii TaxID=4109 RepID=A0A9J5WQ16_SOLCO|nr:hypothetical protein H5410_057832 [Solanum commersonii]
MLTNDVERRWLTVAVVTLMLINYETISLSLVLKQNGASKGNLGLSAGSLCVRNREGGFIYVASYDLDIKQVFEAKILTVKKELRFCVSNNLLPVILETDSLIVAKILDGICEISWSISLSFKKKGNKVENYFSNSIFFCGGTDNKAFKSFIEELKEGKSHIVLDVQKVPNLRTTKC